MSFAFRVASASGAVWPLGGAAVGVGVGGAGVVGSCVLVSGVVFLGGCGIVVGVAVVVVEGAAGDAASSGGLVAGAWASAKYFAVLVPWWYS